MDESEALANVVAITGVDTSAARQLLEATDYNVEAAVNLHFASGISHAATGRCLVSAVPSGPSLEIRTRFHPS